MAFDADVTRPAAQPSYSIKPENSWEIGSPRASDRGRSGTLRLKYCSAFAGNRRPGMDELTLVFPEELWRIASCTIMLSAAEVWEGWPQPRWQLAWACGPHFWRRTRSSAAAGYYRRGSFTFDAGATALMGLGIGEPVGDLLDLLGLDLEVVATSSYRVHLPDRVFDLVPDRERFELQSAAAFARGGRALHAQRLYFGHWSGGASHGPILAKHIGSLSAELGIQSFPGPGARFTQLATAAIDRTCPHVVPAIGMMRSATVGADDDGPTVDKFPTDLAYGGTLILVGCTRVLDNGDSLLHAPAHSELKAVVNRERFLHRKAKRLCALTEIPVDLHQQTFRIDRNQHPAGVNLPLKVADGLANLRRQEIACHFGIVGLNDKHVVKFRDGRLDGTCSFGGLRGGWTRNRCQLEPKRNARPKPSDDPGAGNRWLAGDGGGQPYANGGTAVLEADRWRVAHAPALVTTAESMSEMAVGTVAQCRSSRN